MTSTTPTQHPEATNDGTSDEHVLPDGAFLAGGPPHARAGDLARRVSHRRNELGLTTEELARQAGVDAWFLAYFEQSSDSTLTNGALTRIAVALQTTPLALEGGEVDRPPGPGRAGMHPVLEHLTTEECQDHLSAGGVGRIVLSSPRGPEAFPVNFIFSNGVVVFRTSDAMAGTISGVVAFEVDHIDETMSEGWSVLVRGHARLIEETAERLAVARLDLEAWAGGARLNLVGITPFELTGRVIVQRQPQDRQPPPQHREKREST
jgi:nitroimidazol reductase NimA-like FMN-containing flavoprotein (pyridoxamine 5'-phosphate oxidase superfamily)